MTKYCIPFILLISLFVISGYNPIYAQDKLVECTGQLFYSESDEPVDAVDVSVIGKSSKTRTNENGIFSIVARPNDVIQFSGAGLITSYYKVPENIDNNFMVIKQFISPDTTYYKEVVVTKYLSKEEFDFLMKYGYVPDANLLASRKNMSEKNKNSFIQNSPRAYYENQLIIQQSLQNTHGGYYGQQPTTGINPFAWYDLFKNWKRNTQKRED